MCSELSTKARIGLAAWIGLVLAAMAVFHAAMLRPGSAFAADAAAPVADPGPAVFLVAHPECGCTGPAIDGLAEATRGTGAAVHVVLSGPAADGPDWRASTNAKRAMRHGHVRVRHDPDGRLARLLGARTSGHTVAYDAGGVRRFTGGLSSVRGGSAGSGAAGSGLRAVLDTIAGGEPDPVDTRVFGCAIFDTWDSSEEDGG